MRNLPFNHSPRLAARFARLHRIKRKHQPPTDKASLRQAALDAAATTTATIILTGKRSRSPASD
jgi:hypothetical protein